MVFILREIFVFSLHVVSARCEFADSEGDTVNAVMMFLDRNPDSPNQQVVVDFRDQFDMEPSDECKFDNLEIRDGSHGYSPSLGKYCGHDFPPIIKSSGDALWLRFHSDENVEYKGFRAVYSFEKRNDMGTHEVYEEPCEINKTETEITDDTDRDILYKISHTQIPERFKNKTGKGEVNCMFNLEVNKDKVISLIWEKFNLQHPNECNRNYVNVLNENLDTIKFTYCGAAAEAQLTNNTNLLQIQFVFEKDSVNSTFEARFTPLRKVPQNVNCTDEEYNCQDGYCIDKKLHCDGHQNCLTGGDEDEEECEAMKEEEQFWEKNLKPDLIIILIVFFLILFGMCFTLIHNIVRKLVHDLRLIKKHVNQSRESQLDQLGRKTPTATLLTPVVTILPNLPDNLVNVTEIDAHISIHESARVEEDENECYVPTEFTFPNLIRREYEFQRINGGPSFHHQAACQAHRDSCREFRGGAGSGGGGGGGEEEEDGLVTHSGDSASYIPEMRDNECQTRESLFYNNSSTTTSESPANKGASLSPSPPPPPPPCTMRRTHTKPPSSGGGDTTLPSVITPPIGFTTFGYKNNQKPDKISKNPTAAAAASKEHRFRAEAVIEMERFKSPKHDTSSTDSRPSRPYSVQSTKSAPDVIVTH